MALGRAPLWTWGAGSSELLAASRPCGWMEPWRSLPRVAGPRHLYNQCVLFFTFEAKQGNQFT